MNKNEGKEEVISKIMAMRDRILDTIPEICPQRAVLITESYKETEGLPFIMRKALAMEKILSNMDIYLEEGQLLAGNQASKMRAAPIFPEYSIEWIEEELDTFPERKGDVFNISDDTKEQLRSIFPYWKGKTMEDQVLRNTPDDVMAAWKAGILSPGGITHTGDGHIIIDFFKVLEKGLPAILLEIVEKDKSLKLEKSENIKKHEFYKATKVAINSVILYIKRYIELIESIASETVDKKRRNELEELVEVCKEIINSKPGSFYSALQLVTFLHILFHIESNGHSFSLGRFDQYMYPFYINDINSGVLTHEKALDLLSCFYIKLNTLNKVRPWGHTEFGVGYALYQQMQIGGLGPDGYDATNELSFACLEADRLVRLFQPNIGARLSPLTPDSFLRDCAKCIRLGFGKPAIFNDSVVIPSLMNYGVPVSDARNYAIIGCVTPVVPGKWNHRPTGMTFINVPKILELTLNGGRDPDSGTELLHSDKNLENFNSIEELWEEFKKQFDYYIRLHVIIDNVCDIAIEDHDADPLCSSFVNDCIERGMTAKKGGAIYDFISGLLVGVSTAGDSISAIDELVFKNHSVSGLELKNALLKNFESPEGESIRELCKAAPKFGNDIVEPDMNVVRIYRLYMDLIKDYKTVRYGKGPIGCVYTPSTATISANTPVGSRVGATADGRLAGMPTNEGASPYHGADVSGPTATMLSITRLPNVEMAGGQLLNMKFDPSSLAGDEKLSKFISLLKTFMQLGGFHVQFNIVSAEDLKDAKVHPERHRDLVVRVAGYCALFTSLAPEVQDDIIARTVHAQ